MRMQLRKSLLCLSTVAFALSAGLCPEVRCQSLAQEPSNSSSPIVFPTVLSGVSQEPLSVPSFGYFGMAQCDDSGTMFFAAAAGAVGGITYLSISSDGDEQTVYDLPKYVADAPHNTWFSVSPDGTFHLLYVVPGQPVKWLTFGKYGQVHAVVTLPIPSDINVRSVATTAQGYMLLLGYHPLTSAHAREDGDTYEAVFDPNGNLVTTLKPGNSGIQSNLQFAGPPAQPAVVEGEQFFWITSSGKSMIVIATDGSTVRRVRLPPAPHPGDQIVGLRISGNLALITYMNFKASPHQSYLLLNAATGDEEGLFLPPFGVQGSMTCFQYSRGFTFLSYSKGRMSLVQSHLP